MDNFNKMQADFAATGGLLTKMATDPSLLASYAAEMKKGAEIKTTYTFSPEDRSVFSPENLEADIKLLVPIDTPLRNRLPRTTGMGEASAWKKMTSKLHTISSGAMAGTGTNTAIVFADAGRVSKG